MKGINAYGKHILRGKKVRDGVWKLVVTDQFGFSAIMFMFDSRANRVDVFVPSDNEQSIGLWMRLCSICLDGSESWGF